MDCQGWVVWTLSLNCKVHERGKLYLLEEREVLKGRLVKGAVRRITVAAG